MSISKPKKAEKNADYLAMIDKSMAEAEAGGFVAAVPPHTVESELAEALFRLSLGKLTYEQAAEKAKEAAPKFDINDEMLAYKGINWYAKELLKKM